MSTASRLPACIRAWTCGRTSNSNFDAPSVVEAGHLSRCAGTSYLDCAARLGRLAECQSHRASRERTRLIGADLSAGRPGMHACQAGIPLVVASTRAARVGVVCVLLCVAAFPHVCLPG